MGLLTLLILHFLINECRPVILEKKPELMQNLRNFGKSSSMVLLGTIKICPFVQGREHVVIAINRLLLIYRLEKKTKGQQNGGKHRFHHFRTHLNFAARFAIGNFVK